jgi:hypothetical protein
MQGPTKKFLSVHQALEARNERQQRFTTNEWNN